MLKKIHEVNKQLKAKPGHGTYNDDRKSRKTLPVTWEGEGKLKAVVIGINPSKANDDRLDRTLTVVSRFLDMYGFSEFLMLNIFDCYATNQADIDLTSRTDFQQYEKCLQDADIIFIAWGVANKYRQEKNSILKLLEKNKDKLYCVKNDKGSKPIHPRRISYSFKMVEYSCN